MLYAQSKELAMCGTYPSKFCALGRFLLVLAAGAALLFMFGCGKETISPGGGSAPQYGGAGGTAPQAEAPPADTSQRGSRPYTVMGRTYEPISGARAEGFAEEGIASWYGKDFHGKQTSSGERYDMYGMTAAHKVLPFGTMVMVTNLRNNKSVVVRINDRGPFVDNRIIDLSFSAAQQLDMLDTGTTLVRLTTVGAVEGMNRGLFSGQFYVQVGAFSVESNAANLVQKMNARGYSARSVYAPNIKFWRVQVGPYGNLAQAEGESESLKGEFEHNFIVAD
jgi:rare lipoprotein A